MVVHVEHLHDEVHTLQLRNLENIDRNDLLHEAPPLFWRYLESIDPQTQ